MKKIGLLCLALVLALGSLGIGYAMWSDTLTIVGNVNTGELVVIFDSQYDNDDSQQLDPSEEGSWSGFAAGTPVWTGDRENKDVASTSSTFGDTSAQVTVAEGYPCYWGSVVWDVKNTGSVPVKLYSVTLVALSKNGPVWTGSIPLDIGTRYYVDLDIPNIDTSLDAGDDFSFILSEKWTDQIDPYTWKDALHDGKGYLDITVHVEQDAEEKTNYDFTIDYVFANWNE